MIARLAPGWVWGRVRWSAPQPKRVSTNVFIRDFDVSTLVGKPQIPSCLLHSRKLSSRHTAGGDVFALFFFPSVIDSFKPFTFYQSFAETFSATSHQPFVLTIHKGCDVILRYTRNWRGGACGRTINSTLTEREWPWSVAAPPPSLQIEPAQHPQNLLGKLKRVAHTTHPHFRKTDPED